MAILRSLLRNGRYEVMRARTCVRATRPAKGEFSGTRELQMNAWVRIAVRHSESDGYLIRSLEAFSVLLTVTAAPCRGHWDLTMEFQSSDISRPTNHRP
jgi:hypothetical protein